MELINFKLGNIGKFKNGVNFPASQMGSGIPLVNVKDITNDGFLHPENLDRVNIKIKADYYAESGDIFFVRSSVKWEGIGDVNVFKSLRIPSTHCGFIIRYRVDKDIADPVFLYYLFKNPSYRNYVRGFASGTAIFNISQGGLKFLKLLLPSLISQRKIANILSGYDDLIENNIQRIKLLEELAQITFNDWFNKSKDLRNGWEMKTLKDVAIIIMGQSPESKYYNEEKIGLPFHQGVTGYGFRFPENETWSSEGTRIAEMGDILFSVRAPVGRLNIAMEKMILGRGLSAFRHKKGLNSFLYYQLRKLFFKDDMMGGGAIFNSVTKTDVEKIKIIEPDEKAMIKFNDFAKPIDNLIENLTHQNRLLKEARDILLPRLMTGMIEV